MAQFEPPLKGGASPATGIALKFASTALFAGMAACAKYLSSTYPVGQIVFFRSAFAFLPVIIVVLQSEAGFRLLRTGRPLGHILRSLAGTSGMFAGFAALSLLPLAEATALSFAAPLFTVGLAIAVLGERVGPWRWAASLVGFAGVVLVAQPLSLFGSAVSAFPLSGVGLGLLGAFLAALAATYTRYLARAEHPITIVFYFTLGSTVASALTLPFAAVAPDAPDLLLLAIMGILGGLAQILLTNSYRFADASTLAPIDYTQMIWAGTLGYLIFGDVPTAMTLVGAFVIACAGTFIVIRERIVARRAIAKTAALD